MPAHAITLSVNINDPSCDDASGTPFCSIGAALGAALPGDTITVANGVYPESVVIAINSIGVIGQGRPVIDGRRVDITADGTTFSGFDVSNGGTIEMVCVLSTCENNLITDNRVLGGGSPLGGIIIVNGNNNTISRNLVRENLGSGIVVDGQSNRLIKNVVTRNPGQGIVIVAPRASRNLLKRNKATRNGGAGVLVSAPFNRLDRNIATGNQLHGFLDTTRGAGTQGTANRYKKNKCSRNRRGGSSPRGLCRPQK